MMSALAARVRSLLGSRALAPRERVLVAAFSAVLAVYAGLGAFDWAQSARGKAIEGVEARRAAVAEAARLNDSFLSGMTARQTDRVRDWSFEDATIAIARLKAQTSLEEITRAAGVENARVVGDPATTGAGRIHLFRASIEGSFRWDTFVALLTALGSDRHSIEVTSVRVDSGQARPVFRLGVRAPLSVSERRASSEVKG